MVGVIFALYMHASTLRTYTAYLSRFSGSDGVHSHMVGVILALYMHASTLRTYTAYLSRFFSSNFGLQQHVKLWASRVVSETIKLL